MTSRNLTSYFRSMDVIEIITGDGKLILRDRENMMNRENIQRQPIIFYPQRQPTYQVD